MLRLPRIFLFFNITRRAQWLPSERFHLLSLHKTRSESPGAAPPQIFPILKHYAPPQKRSDSPVFIKKVGILRRQTNHSARFWRSKNISADSENIYKSLKPHKNIKNSISNKRTPCNFFQTNDVESKFKNLYDDCE